MSGARERHEGRAHHRDAALERHTPTRQAARASLAALACSLHRQWRMVEAIRDQWVIVAAIVAVAAAVAWLVARR